MESVSLALSSVSIKDSPDQDRIIKIIVDDQEIECPKQILVQNSKWFEAYFAFQSENLDDIVHLKGGLDYASIKTILDGLSNPKGTIDIHEENVQNVLQASTFLQCTYLS